MNDKIFRVVVVFLLVVASLLLTQATPAQKKAPPSTVSSVDLKRYAGVWYEIARYPNKFQKQCVSDVTAEYVLEDDGDLDVINRCKTSNGETDEAKGDARIKDNQTKAKLEVRFAPKFLSFLPQVWGDYWILDLGADYDYSLVGSPDRKYLWVLSRTPQIDQAKYDAILQAARREGYNPDKLVKTVQGK